ncbi:MAG: glycosyltransferase family 4 protein [Gammaproteobacteria bacterium]|nr:glycosyltransferase family 4 protein [Gammaproteobacteria bacterium]
MDKIKIAHITSVHPHKDIRIFQKECKSLSKKYEVHLFNKEFDGVFDGIFFHKVHFYKNRFLRVLSSWFLALKHTINNDHKIIHIHDPELMIAIPFWKLFNKTIILDIHENYSKQIEVKSYLPKTLKPIIKKLISLFEICISKITDHIIIVHKDLTPNLESHKSIHVISNAPILDYSFQKKVRKKQFCYIGLISQERGVLNLAKILDELKIKLVLAGNFSNSDVKEKILNYKNVEFLGWIDAKKKADLISDSLLGCCTFLPIEHHLISNPNKIYEYLNYGTPVLCSDFDSYKEIISVDKEFIFYCDILNKKNMIKTINEVIDLSDEEINDFGLKGHEFIKQNYNWGIQEKKLLELYDLCESNID